MELTKDTPLGQFQITAYDERSIFVNGQPYFSSLLIMPDKLITSWEPQSIHSITDQDISFILDLKPEIVLIGTGAKLIHLKQSLFKALYEQKIGVEIMDTPAACRTYAILMSEGRRVLAGLFLPLTDGRSPPKFIPAQAGT